VISEAGRIGAINWADILPKWDWTAIIPFYDLGQRLFFGEQMPKIDFETQSISTYC